MSDRPSPGGDVTEQGVFRSVLDGYTAVYNVLPNGKVFNRIWREKAYLGSFPIEFAHIGFLTLAEAEVLRSSLHLDDESTFADLACGTGGPGLWLSHRSGARLIGVDPAEPGLELARRRAEAVGLAGQATFCTGTFERSGLDDDAVDAVTSVEAFQYAPDKTAALAEFARIVKPGGSLAIVCFEVDPSRVSGLPVLGADPVADYRPMLEQAGFALEIYNETPGWRDRVYGAFQALLDASGELIAEMGEEAAAATLTEAMITVDLNPYLRRVLAVATLG
jgi:SAM-dependent methyltransferase